MPLQDSPAPEPPAAAPLVPAERADPRATMRTFLEAMNEVAAGRDTRMDDAVACLDLGQVPAIIREERGPQAAIELKEVVDRLAEVYLPEVPDDPAGPPWVFHEEAGGRIVLARTEAGDWRFTAETVAALPDLLAAVEGRERKAGRAIDVSTLSRSLWLRGQLPEALRARAFYLEHWQWLGLLVLVFLGVLLDRLVSQGLAFTVGRLFHREHWSVKAQTLRRSMRPFGLLAMALGWLTGLSWLGLPDEAYVVLKVAAEFVVAASAVWGAYRLVNVLAEVLEQWAARTDSQLDDLLVPLAVRTLKIFIVAVGLVFLANQLKVDLWPLVTGLGIGGLAFALAAQDIIKNLFGSLMIVFDRTFQVGDWVCIGDTEGTVERVGFRSTKVRTFYDSLITVPNSNLVTTAVDNLGLRSHRRWKTVLSITYETPPERIEAFCEGIRELVRRHPYTRKDYYQVYLNGFGAASLDVLLYVFHDAPDWSTELRERHRLMLDILRLAGRLGVEFAYPTQTLHLNQGPVTPPDPASYVPADQVDRSAADGRRAAAGIVSDFGLDGSPPPPVNITIPAEEARGDGV